MKAKHRIVVAVTLFIAVVIIGCWVQEFLAVDSCLDQGGRWDYDNKVCVYS